MTPEHIRSLVLVLGCALLAGCGAGDASQRRAGVALRVTERDFHVATSVNEIRAGLVDVSVHNQGPDDHELIVVRQPSSRSLPVRRDGVTIDEDRLLPVTVGPGLVPGPPGSVRVLSVRLSPGRYVLFCNMAGHYLGGMHTELLVRR